MKIYRTIWLLLFLFVFSVVHGQDEFIEYTEVDSMSQIPSPKMILPEFRLGLSPSAVFSGFPSAQLSGDLRINDFSEVSLEMGFIFASALQGKGFRSRLSYEAFIYRGEHIGFFVGAAATSSNVWEFVQYTIQYENAYFRDHVGFRRRNMIGGFLTAGMKFELGGGAIMELSSGLGYTSFYTSRLENQPEIQFFNITLLPSRPGWTPFPGYYNNLNVSMPIDITPLKKKLYEYKSGTKSKKKKSSKKKKRKKKRKRRR